MKKHAIISIVLILVILIIPLVAHASPFINTKLSFGGKIIATSITDVTCYSTGTGPIVLEGSLFSIPFYTNTSFSSFPFISATPQEGDWILGTADRVPDLETCDLQIGTYQIPFPVRKTSNYGVSGQ